MKIITTILFFIMLGACVDRLHYDIAKSDDYPLVIYGYISDQPGPYIVNVSRSFDIESKETTKTPVQAKRVILSDNEGTTEELTETSIGTYETKPTGIRGRAGNIYTLKVELFDEKIYESAPDTLSHPGSLDSVYYSFSEKINSDGGTEYGFDILANSTKGSNSGGRFLWNMTGTFKANTHPEIAPQSGSKCYLLENGVCNKIPFCSGLRNISNNYSPPIYERIGPCTCCTCWYQIFSERVILSDNIFSTSQKFDGVKIQRVPVTPWIFAYKIHIEVKQLSLSHQSFQFFKAIRDQRNAVSSLFQPVSGKIPSKFIQLNGVKAPVQGIFYATAIVGKTFYITREDVPHYDQISSLDALVESGIGLGSCLELFPNATDVKPSFWID